MNVEPNLETGDPKRALLAPGFSRSPAPLRARPDRVISLVSLSHNVADRFIAETLAQTLRNETGGSVLLIHLEPGDAKFSLQDWARRQPTLNGQFGLADLVERAEWEFANLRIGFAGDSSEAGSLPSLVAHGCSHFQFVVVHVGADVPTPLLMECLARSDRAFLLLQPTSRDLYNRDLLLREIRSQPLGDSWNVKTVVCREKGEERFNELLKRMGSSVHGFIHGCPTPAAAVSLRNWHDQTFNADIRRLVREIARRRVGLALSSGGARSLAHIGVIQVLEEHGIEVDVVAGCSMGAYIGAVWAFGYDGVAMEKLAREVEHRWGLLELIDPFVLPREGFLRGEKVKRRLKRSIGDVHFSELVRPLRVVATQLSTLDRTVIASGEVAAAVHASSAIPGACVPVRIDGELYIDGGIADPLPVDVLEEMGIERILAVNTIPTSAYLRGRVEMERERAERRARRTNKLKGLLNHYLNYFAPGNILDTILRSFNGAQMRVADLACQHAHVVLRPLSLDGRWHDFRHPGKYILLGRREAEEHLAEIKDLVDRKEPYERDLAPHAMATVT